MAMPLKLRYLAEAAVFFAFMGLFRLLGLDGASALGGFIGRAILYRTGMTKRARENIRAALPEKSPTEVEAILVAMWDNLGRTFAEYAHLEKINVGGRIQASGVENGLAAMARGQGVLLVSGHFANWEVMLNAGAQTGFEGGFVNRPPNNPHVARYLAAKRAARGYTEQISKVKGAKRIFALLRGGKAVLMLVDQKTNDGIAAPFFGRDAMTTPVPAALALRLGSSLLFASNHRRGGAHFAVTLHAPMTFTPSGDEERDIQDLTTAINARIEEMVRADPASWLWIHRRWPTARDAPGKRAP
jgi:KDO2-lipid IV(A) lauroyltransferase